MTSSGKDGRPSGWLFHFQYSRNPLRCQAMTVSGLTMTNADRQPFQNSFWQGQALETPQSNRTYSRARFFPFQTTNIGID